MICNNCGATIAPGATFCTKCGARVLDLHNNFGQRDVKRKPKGLITALWVLSGLLIAIILVGFLLVFSGGNTKISVTVDTYPSQSESESVVLTGSVSTGKGAAVLSINGDFIENIPAKERNKQWSKNVNLSNGENTFLITVSDSKGNSDTEKISITYRSNLIFPEGTVLVKSSESGVYIRPTPQISEKFVMLIPYTDFTSRFVCVGEESTDIEGYVWCKVRTPSSGEGWVRSDLMKILH